MKLITRDGSYEAPNLRSLLILVLRHRTWHWWRGEGWRD